jgi:hypothetical protein
VDDCVMSVSLIMNEEWEDLCGKYYLHKEFVWDSLHIDILEFVLNLSFVFEVVQVSFYYSFYSFRN